VDGRTYLFSFLGLGAGKDRRAITTRAYALDVAGGRWALLADVPGAVGRIAPTAQALDGKVYVFGGYSVADDGKEVSEPAVDVYDIRARRYSRAADMPVPVDDTVSGIWRERLIFLVGGWSTDDNVDAVQVFDPARNQWMASTPITGTPVFGHAGAIAGDTIVYCGGAKVQAPRVPKYAINAECYRGDISPDDPATVAWRVIPHHPGPARYRAAAGPVAIGTLRGVMFVGGTTNPYNYNGVGYDGQPSEPEAVSWIFDIDGNVWIEGPRLPAPTMDHRGLPFADGSWWTIGGFDRGQVVSTRVTRLTPSSPQDP
jgi:hypothetical protein